MARTVPGLGQESRLCAAMVRFRRHSRHCLARHRMAGSASPQIASNFVRKPTVVSPTPTAPQQARKPRSAWPLFLIVAMCLAPVVFALLAYYVPSLGLRPMESTNYGTLIQPQRPIPSTDALPLTTIDGQAFDLASLHGKWLLVSADASACPESCVKKLFILRNSHASQGKNVERLARIWFMTD